jgi:hypothetical protein
MNLLTRCGVIAGTVVFVSLVLSIGHAQALKRGRCPLGYEIVVIHFLGPATGLSPFIAQCQKTETESFKEYVSYSPCLPLGTYNANNEEPGTGGLDRCTYAGITGPALPCGFGQTRGTRLNQIDRCYVVKTREVIKKADIVLVD